MGKYVDIPAIVQVIGGIYLDPSLLDLTDKYNLCKHDFTERFHKMIFGTIFQLHALGAKEITISTIEDYLKDKPENEALFVKNNGEKWLTELSQITKPEAFDYYYGRVKKLSLLRAYHNCGIDVKDIYDDDEIFDTKKIKEQGEWLDEHSMADISKRIDEKIDRIKAEYTGEEFKKPRQAGEGIEELLQSLKENPDFGVPLYGDLVNTVTRGARLGKFYLRSAPSGVGKALPNSTVIPTPEGYKKVGKVKIGDYLFDAFGKPTKVLAVYPQGLKRIWEVEFSDGRKAQCCEEHLWSYCTTEQSETQKENRQFYTSTTKGLLARITRAATPEYQILVPMQKAVQYPEKEFSANPYKVGLFWGDKNTVHFDGLPQGYLCGSIEQRQALLDGILEGGGVVNKEAKKISFQTVSSTFRDEIAELAHGLGYKTKQSEIYQANLPISYLIEIFDKENNSFNSIVKIAPTDKYEEMTCFYVDNEEHLFLTNDYIVTHNTRSMLADAAYISCCSMWDADKNEWVLLESQQPTFYITTEQRLDEIQTMLLAFIAGVDEDKILESRCTEEEQERLQMATGIISQSPLYIEEMPDFSMDDVENQVKRGIRDHNARYIFLDYIHSSIKILEEITRRTGGIKLREDSILFMIAIKLKDICVQNDVFILSSTQLNASYVDATEPDQNLLRGAKSIADKIDSGWHILSVTNDDLAALAIDENDPNRPTHKLAFYKNRRGKYKSVYLWCRANLSQCKLFPAFATTYDYKPIKMDKTKVAVDKSKGYEWN